MSDRYSEVLGNLFWGNLMERSIFL